MARFGIGRENKDFSAGKVLFLNRWHFVCGTYDGRAITVFVDGAAGPQVPLEEGGLDFDGHVTIGGAGMGSVRWKVGRRERVESSVDADRGETIDGGRGVVECVEYEHFRRSNFGLDDE